MKNARIMLYAVCGVVLLASVVGFCVVFNSEPHLAFARAIIDLGMLVAILSIIVAGTPKPKILRTSELADTLHQYSRGVFPKRTLEPEDFEDLSDIAVAINVLGRALQEQKAEAAKREANAIEPTILPVEHSYHPELGPVRSAEFVPSMEKPVSRIQSSPPLRPSAMLAESAPKKPVPVKKQALPAQLSMPPPVKPATVPVPTPLPSPPPEPPRRASSAYGEFASLYADYVDALQRAGAEIVDFSVFRATVEKTVEELVATYSCKAVRFEVVRDGADVALRPKLIR